MNKLWRLRAVCTDKKFKWAGIGEGIVEEDEGEEGRNNLLCSFMYLYIYACIYLDS